MSRREDRWWEHAESVRREHKESERARDRAASWRAYDESERFQRMLDARTPEEVEQDRRYAAAEKVRRLRENIRVIFLLLSPFIFCIALAYLLSQLSSG